MKTSYETQLKTNPSTPVIAIAASGQIASKAVYFLPWQPNSDSALLCKSIEQFVSNAMEKVATENYRSVAFPAIGCGQHQCSISTVAQTSVNEAHRQLAKHPMSVSFVIQPQRTDIYDEFQKQINLLQLPQQQQPLATETVSATIGNGTIEVVKGDITTQKVNKLKIVPIRARHDSFSVSYRSMLYLGAHRRKS
jgi:hypothetical protein